MKKGFTITELLAVLVIISILIIVMFPTYINTSNSIKESNLENIKSIISKTMLEYANKHYIDEIKPSISKCSDQAPCCMYFSINFIKEKDIFQTTNGDIIDPVTNKSLEGYIKVTYNINRYLLEAEYAEDLSTCGKCKYADVENGVEKVEVCS